MSSVILSIVSGALAGAAVALLSHNDPAGLAAGASIALALIAFKTMKLGD
mgnify:CR=1 FL=1